MTVEVSFNKVFNSYIFRSSTSQVASAHSLVDCAQSLNISGRTLEGVKQSKLLGDYLDEHLTWGEHVNQLFKSCYATLSHLRKTKQLH